ncbi:MAG: uroporphyrinogen decarboxylase family protein [Candidatus Hermodarchaeota archaeon]
MQAKDLSFEHENHVSAMQKIQELYDLEIIFPRMDLDEYVEIVSRNIKKEELKHKDEWLKLNPENIISIPDIDIIKSTTTYKVLKDVSSELKSNFKYIGGYLPAPYTLASLVMNLQISSELVIFEPDFLKSVVKQSKKAIIQYAETIKNFVDIFNILAPSECTIMQRSYRELVSEFMNEIISYCTNDLNKPCFIHFCSRKNKQIVNYDVVKPMKDAGLIGLNIPNIIEQIDLAKELELILFGGIDPVKIQQDPKELIIAQIKEMLTKTKDIKFILGTNCQVKWAPGQISSEGLLNIFKQIKNLLIKD